MAELKGIVEKIRFHNPQNGWTVLELSGSTTSKHNCATLVQAGVQVGTYLELEGEWLYDKKFGKQFKATSYKVSVPSTSDGMVKYLQSNLFTTVTKKIAEKIVETFGDNLENIIEKEPVRLLEVKNFNEEKMLIFVKEWEELREGYKVIIELENLGISSNMALKIYNHFGDSTMKDIKEDPYQLIKLITGVAFKTADTIAMRLGFDLNSPERIIAGMTYLLEENLDEGNTYLTESELYRYLDNVLEIEDKEGIRITLETFIDIGVFVKIDDKISTKVVYETELFISDWIKNKKKDEIIELYDLDQKIASECQSKNIILSDEQKDSVKSILSSPFSVLTGGAGVGKTTTVKLIIQLLTNMNKKVLLCAPTGRAAQRMSEVTDMDVSTIHRLLKYEHESGGFAFNKYNKLDVEFLIVDEASMLDIFLTKSLMESVPDNTQLLFIGDPNQLPAVGAGDVLDSIITVRPCEIRELTQIFRQKEDASIINFANQIIKGDVPKIPSPFINIKFFEEKKDCLFLDTDDVDDTDALKWIEKNKAAIINNNLDYKENPSASRLEASGICDLSFFKNEWYKLSFEQLKKEDKLKFKNIKPYSSILRGLDSIALVKKVYTEWIEKYYGKMELQILTPQKKHVLGSKNLNQEIQQTINPYSEGKKELKIGDRVFREGDKVIQTKNNYQKNIFNGDIGFIKDIKTMDNIKITFGTGDYAKDVYLTRENMFDIDLAYSITVHKSQGSEFDCVIVPLVLPHKHMLFRNLLYTALTRGKKLVIFVGSRKALALAVKNNLKIVRKTHLKRMLREE